MNSKIIIVLALAAMLQFAPAFEIKDCAANKKSEANVLAVNIDACPDTSIEYCTFIKGRNVTVTLDLEPTKVFSQANISIKAKVGPVYIPLPLNGPAEACGNYGFNCPTKVGEKQRMVFSLPVLHHYPSINTTIHFELNDENDKSIVCREIPAHIKS